MRCLTWKSFRERISAHWLPGTPYGINTHRLLVRGHRTKYIEETVVRVQKEAEKKETGIWLLAGGGAVFLIIIIIVVVKRRRKRRNLQR